MAGLTTHVLDLARGRPASGVTVELFARKGGALTSVSRTKTNADGRSPEPLLGAGQMAPGAYQLEFHVGDYFRETGLGAHPPFLDIVPVAFAIGDPNAHYHVPLLISPYGYSTYRGS